MRVARSFEFAQRHRQRARQAGERHSGAGGPCLSGSPPSRHRRPSRPGCRARKHIVEWMEAKARARSSMGLLVLGTAVSLAVAILSGCGLKTPPRPVGQVLPPTAGFQVRQRPSEALISWIVPSQADGDRFGGLRGYRLLLHRLPLFCADCPPEERFRIDVPADAPELAREGGRVYYALPLDPPALLSVRLVTVYGIGSNKATAPVILEPSVDIPVAKLNWRWAVERPAGTAAPGPRAVQFFWETPRERLVQVIGPDGRPREREQRYRANLYQRLPPQPWPVTPLNPRPVAGTQWIMPPLRPRLPEQATREEYILRLVDQFESEGPPSPTVEIPIAARSP